MYISIYIFIPSLMFIVYQISSIVGWVHNLPKGSELNKDNTAERSTSLVWY